MKLVEILKEKRQQFQWTNGEFMRRIEPQVRELTASLNNTVSNSFASTWFSRFIPVNPGEQEQAVVVNAGVFAVKQRLVPLLGQEIHVGPWHCVDQTCINDFAEITGDRQWIHVDVERARREGPFHSTIAHGFLILALLPKLRELDAYGEAQYPEARMVVNCGIQDVQFLAPVKSGSDIRCRTVLRDLTAHRKSLDVLEEVCVEIRGSNRIACRAALQIRIFL